MDLFWLKKDCCALAKKYGFKGMAAVEKRMSQESSFLELFFSPDTEGVEAGKALYSFDETACVLDAKIPVSNKKEVQAVFICKVALSSGQDLEYQLKEMKYALELICTTFNPKAPKSIVLKDTRWGKVEVRHSDAWRNIYRLDGAVLYNNGFIIEYLPEEEAARWAEEKLTGIPDYVKEIDENFALDYPLFKMKIRRYDGDSLSHECDEAGVWWVNVPQNCDFSRENVKMCLLKYFDKVLLSAGQQYFPQRVEYFQAKMRTPKTIRNIVVEQFYNTNKIAYNLFNAVSPGSTQDDGTRDLHFDAELMAYPEKFTDSVIIHELCHNRVWAHNKNFYDLESNWCFLLLNIYPHHYDEFFKTHRLVLFARDPWQERQ